MAKNITVTQLGAAPKVMEASTVAELISSLGLTNVTAKVNGATVADDHVLSDYSFVTFGEKVKGGL